MNYQRNTFLVECETLPTMQDPISSAASTIHHNCFCCYCQLRYKELSCSHKLCKRFCMFGDLPSNEISSATNL